MQFLENKTMIINNKGGLLGSDHGNRLLIFDKALVWIPSGMLRSPFWAMKPAF